MCGATPENASQMLYDPNNCNYHIFRICTQFQVHEVYRASKE